MLLISLIFSCHMLFAKYSGEFTTPSTPAPPILSAMARTTVFSGGRIRPGSICERLLDEAVQDLGRDFTREELERNLEMLLKATGETLKPVYIKRSPGLGGGMGFSF